MMQQIIENLGAIRKSKDAQCKFGSALVCMFFYVMKEFPSFWKVNWDQNKTIVDQINDFIAQMGDNLNDQMSIYFNDFKSAMKRRMRIPVSLVEKHVNDICFLVDIDYTYIQAVLPRVRWLRPLGYELDVDHVSEAITTLLVEERDKTAKSFGTYDVVKSRVVTDLKTTSVVKKKEKMVKKFKKKFGVEESNTKSEAKETSDDEEEGDEEKEEDEPKQGPLELTQGLGEDKDESAEEEEAKEAPIKGKVTKGKAKKSPTPQPKQKKATMPASKKLATRATTRASTQKAKEEATRKKRTTKKA